MWFPGEFKPCFGPRVVAVLRAGMAFGQIGGVRGNLVGDDAILHVFLVRQTQVFLGRDVAEDRTPIPTDHRRPDGAGDVVVAGSEGGRQGAARVEWGLGAQLATVVHVCPGPLHGYLAWTFVPL